MTLFRHRGKTSSFDFLFIWVFLCIGWFLQGLVGAVKDGCKLIGRAFR